MLRQFVIGLVLSLAAVSAHAGVGEWTYLGAVGRRASRLYVVGNPTHLYLLSSEGGLVSDDLGDSWQPIIAPVFNNTRTHVERLAAMDQNLARGVLIGVGTSIEFDINTRNGYDLGTERFKAYSYFIIRSENGGQTWQRDPLILPDLPPQEPTSLLLKAAPGGRLFLSVLGKVTFLPTCGSTETRKISDTHSLYRSDDAGLTWQPLSLPIAAESITSGSNIQRLDVEDDAGKALYLDGSSVDYVAETVNTCGSWRGSDIKSTAFAFRSTDGGMTWQPTSPKNVDLLFTSPVDPKYRWKMVSGKPYRSLDGGQTWRTVEKGVQNFGFGDLDVNFIFDPNEPRRVFMLVTTGDPSIPSRLYEYTLRGGGGDGGTALKGDVNGDGRVTVSDAVLVLRIIVGLPMADASPPKRVKLAQAGFKGILRIMSKPKSTRFSSPHPVLRQ